MASSNLYKRLLEEIFFLHFREGETQFTFEREELVKAATDIGEAPPKNLGDAIYAIRYRIAMPERILATAPAGLEWVIEPAGRSVYRFKLSKGNRILPNENLVTIKIPDATPEIIASHALSDEQALLAKVRYNRLLDIFLGITAYSLQNHLRTSVANIGQIEIDEVYVGVDQRGRQYVVPVQAKGGADRLSVVQTGQDIAFCEERFPNLICRAVSAQFMKDDVIAMFDLGISDGELRIIEERHYRLVHRSDIGPEDLALYNRS